MKKINDDTIILWIFILYLGKAFFINNELTFIIGLIIIFIYVLKYKKIIIPKIPGLLVYSLYLFIPIIIGICKYPLYLVIRDTFYEFGNIVFIYIGYLICNKKNEGKSLWKTLILANFVVSTICILRGCFLIFKSGISFINFRTYFVLGVYSISFLLPLMIIYKAYLKENVFTKKTDAIILAIWTVQIVMNFSRTAIIDILIILVALFMVLIYYKKITPNLLKSMIKFFLIIFLILLFAIKIVPKNINDRFITKFKNMFTEINSKNNFYNAGEAEGNWRGYEIICAQDFWKNQKLFIKIFGNGNGTIIPIQFIPEQWKNTVIEQNGKRGVSVLHNAYYSLLCKGGIVCLILFIRFILLNIIKGLKLCKYEKKQDIIQGLFIIGLFIVLIINAYIIMHMFQNDIQITWALLIGWISAIIKNKENIDEERIL